MNKIKKIIFLCLITLCCCETYAQQSFKQGFFESDDDFIDRVLREYIIKIDKIEKCDFAYCYGDDRSSGYIQRLKLHVIPTRVIIEDGYIGSNETLSYFLEIKTEKSGVLLYSGEHDLMALEIDYATYKNEIQEWYISSELLNSKEFMKYKNEKMILSFKQKGKISCQFRISSLGSFIDEYWEWINANYEKERPKFFIDKLK